MPPSTGRFGRAFIAAFFLAAGIDGCGGGGAAMPRPAAVSLGSSVVPTFDERAGRIPARRHGLGFRRAKPAELARFRRLRRPAGLTPLPLAVDLSSRMPAVGDQGAENSCSAWSTAYAMRGYEAREDVWSSIAPQTSAPNYNFSPAFVYNQINGGHDDGATLSGALTLMQQEGAATLTDMPYVDGQYTTPPSAAALADALKYKIQSFAYIEPTDLATMKSQLAAGIPIVLGLNVYTNFYGLGTNEVYTAKSGTLAGGHAVTIVGYDDTAQTLKFINSWGVWWGTAGYGYLSYGVLSTIAIEAYSAVDADGAANPAALPSPVATALPTVAPTPTAAPTTAPTPGPKHTAKPSPHPKKPTPAHTPKPSAKPTHEPKPKHKPKPKHTATPSPEPSAAP